MTQNELYELIADFGEAYGTALRRDSHLARGIDWPENWLEIVDVIGETRAEMLRIGEGTPSQSELQALIKWQIEHALDESKPDITPTLWLCPFEDDVLLIEGWGDTLHTELQFRLIGRFPDETSAIKELKFQYFIHGDDIEISNLQ